MTLLLDNRRHQPPTAEAVASFGLATPDVGQAVLRALDGQEIDLSNLHCGEQVSGFLRVDDRTHFLRVTEARRPSAEALDHTVVMLPGWTEMVDRGSGSNLHDAVAHRFPASRVVSIATDGVGMHCKPLSWGEGLHLSFDTMGADRLEIADMVATDGPITMVNMSMGTVIGLRTAMRNLREQRLQLEHIVNHSHAQVTASRLLPDMAVRFLPHMAANGVREGIHHPREAVSSVVGLISLLATHSPALVGNVKNLLLHPTHLQDVFMVAQEVPTTYIFGTKDPLSQQKALRKLELALPGQIHLVALEGKGHAVSLDAHRAGRDIALVDRHGIAA